jgi:hypothetical protein
VHDTDLPTPHKCILHMLTLRTSCVWPQADILGAIVDSPLIRERVKDDTSEDCAQWYVCENRLSISAPSEPH